MCYLEYTISTSILLIWNSEQSISILFMLYSASTEGLQQHVLQP